MLTGCGHMLAEAAQNFELLLPLSSVFHITSNINALSQQHS
jgi:hypothetical protein